MNQPSGIETAGCEPAGPTLAKGGWPNGAPKRPTLKVADAPLADKERGQPGNRRSPASIVGNL